MFVQNKKNVFHFAHKKSLCIQEEKYLSQDPKGEPFYPWIRTGPKQIK